MVLVDGFNDLWVDSQHSHRILTVLLYMVLHGSHQSTPNVSINLPAPWIRHGIIIDHYPIINH